MKLELDELDATAGILEPIQDNLSNRPGGSLPSLLIEAIKLFQKSDIESTKIGLKKVREAIKDSRHEDWDKQWPRVIELLNLQYSSTHVSPMSLTHWANRRSRKWQLLRLH